MSELQLPHPLSAPEQAKLFWTTIDHLIEEDIIQDEIHLAKILSRSVTELLNMRTTDQEIPEDWIKYLILRYQVSPLYILTGRGPVIVTPTQSRPE